MTLALTEIWPDFWPILLLLLAYGAWVYLASLSFRNPRSDPAYGITIGCARFYARAFHRLTIVGAENIPPEMHAGPLVVVSNHTAGIDPLLIQAACPFHIRWMMANDMMLNGVDWFWNWVGVISVNREGRDTTSARTAIRALENHEIIGIFPEGGLERPARALRPFHAGVGLIVSRSGSPVLPVIVEGTPQINPAWASLRVPSHSRITFMPLIWYSPEIPPAAIAADLRERFREWTTWPLNDSPVTALRGDSSYV